MQYLWSEVLKMLSAIEALQKRPDVHSTLSIESATILKCIIFNINITTKYLCFNVNNSHWSKCNELDFGKPMIAHGMQTQNNLPNMQLQPNYQTALHSLEEQQIKQKQTYDKHQSYQTCAPEEREQNVATTNGEERDSCETTRNRFLFD